MKSFLEFANEKDFISQRKKGAAKIAEMAEKKGGIATLTKWHFAAKLPVYKEMKDKDEKFLTERFNELKKKISVNMSQKNFQEVMGELEVVGEVLIQLKQPTDY